MLRDQRGGRLPYEIPEVQGTSISKLGTMRPWTVLIGGSIMSYSGMMKVDDDDGDDDEVFV